MQWVDCFGGLIHHPAIVAHVECMFGQIVVNTSGFLEKCCGIVPLA